MFNEGKTSSLNILLYFSENLDFKKSVFNLGKFSSLVVRKIIYKCQVTQRKVFTFSDSKKF
jgi:hypothetical protein